MPIRKAVLIIDHDALFRESCRDLLATGAFSVVEASNGAEALIWCQRGRADVILLELEMPVLDGRGFLEYRLRHPALWGIPVVALTSQLAAADLRETLHSLGVVRLLQKPVAPEDIVDAVRAALVEPHTMLPPRKGEAAGGRRDPRVALSIPLRVRTDRSLETGGRLYDLSAGGLGVYLSDRLTHGETFTLILDIQGKLFLDGFVQWAGDILTALGYRHGLRFMERRQDAFPLHVYSLVRGSPEARA
jgi:two-component system, chemotaxis family, chemotaxis protein CheY